MRDPADSVEKRLSCRRSRVRPFCRSDCLLPQREHVLAKWGYLEGMTIEEIICLCSLGYGNLPHGRSLDGNIVNVRTHSEDEAQLLKKEKAGIVFLGEYELAASMSRHVLEGLAVRDSK